MFAQKYQLRLLHTCTGIIYTYHGSQYSQKYQAPAFKRGNIATVVFVQNVSVTKPFVSWITVVQLQQQLYSYSAYEGLHGQNVLNKNYSCYVTTLDSWRTCPLVLLHVARSLYDVFDNRKVGLHQTYSLAYRCTCMLEVHLYGGDQVCSFVEWVSIYRMIESIASGVQIHTYINCLYYMDIYTYRVLL